MPKFAANISMMFTEVPFLQRFEAAANAGFQAVEFLFPYEFAASAIADELNRYKLQNVLFNLWPGDWTHGARGIAALPGHESEFHASVVQALDYAAVLGTLNLHAMAGLIPAGTEHAACRAVYLDNLRYAATACAQHGKTLLIEPINGRDMPGYFLQRQDDAHAICAEIGAPNLKVQMDLYHAQIVEGDLATKIKQYLPRIGHIQIASVPERHEPNGGEVNYAYLFQLLDELGYNGWLGCEYRPEHGTLAGLGWIQAIKAKM